MRGWGQRPLVMVRSGEEALDRALAARGYLEHEPSVLLAAPIGALAARRDETAITCHAPLARMAEIWAADGIRPARLAVMDRAPGPKTWLLGRFGDRAAGCGFVALHGGVAMLSALVVAPDARRRGLGARLTRGAAGWAAAQGASTLALAVTRGNAPARALYAGLGMAEAGAYHYRIAPPERT
jgi:GNAT superfamily N-acetyltransferase